MEVEFSLTELKEKFGTLEYVKINAIVSRHYGSDCEIVVSANPIKPLDLIIPSAFLGSIVAKEIGNQEFKARLDSINKVLEKRKGVEKMDARCRQLIQKLKELAYSDEE